MNKLIFANIKHKCKSHICLKCLHNFSSEKLLSQHMQDNLCTKKDGPAKCVFPPPDTFIEFKNNYKQLKHPL